MSIVAVAVSAYAMDHNGNFPPSNSEYAEGALRASKHSKYLSLRLGEKWELKDAFGNLLVLERDSNGTMKIRSPGWNGIDEDGGGDDVEATAFGFSRVDEAN